MTGHRQRKRGVKLSPQGINRLQGAVRRAEAAENEGNRYDVDQLSQRTGVAKATLSRLWASSTGVDRKTARLVFGAFGLELTEMDLLTERERAGESRQISTGLLNSKGEQPDRSARAALPYPSGPVPLNSPLYVSRPPLEERSFQEITQPGCIVRIKAPSGYGKTSLLIRIVDRAQALGYTVASLDLTQVDPDILNDAGGFLRWFCGALVLRLDLTSNLSDYWNDILGNSMSATEFVREQILEPTTAPLVLNLQEFNQLFAYPKTSQVFLPLLRSWHEEARHEEVWQRLRLVVSYSTDSYLPLDINQSPFNVGLPVFLPEFTAEQISTLAGLHCLTLSKTDLERLMALVGGIPVLVRIALYHLSQDRLSLDELIRSAPTSGGIFHNYLQQMLIWLREGTEPMATLKTLVTREEPVAIDPILAYQLEATGLVQSTPEGWVMGMNLYRDYLRKVLL